MKMKFNLLTITLLLVGNFAAKASAVDTLLVESKAMGTIKNIVLLPDSYDPKGEALPVLYLLHGAFGDHTDWMQIRPDLGDYADKYGFIIICPDGGFNSWYFDSPIDEEMQYETYIAKELVQKVDAEYKTITNRNGRAITGLSMGGHGALYLAFRHQDIWAAAGSTSGGVDIRPFPGNWDIAKRIGEYSEFRSNWEENTIINMVYLLKKNSLKLIIDCGVDDFFYGVNKQLHQKLVDRNIPHDYIERPGEHNMEYWANSITYQLLFFNDFFNSQEKE
ncbi:alpha/beta hydrolase family protein [Flammeovirgaceae bacterium SG7u.111]|nr:alpha/beta hydrolase family protein [Flammeovirgaceae bacterium SG7u.132]WPO34111.1 alpha/beta hydrolase family protein [Flammeovirgaceae bacterium SG7u.111]